MATTWTSKPKTARTNFILMQNDDFITLSDGSVLIYSHRAHWSTKQKPTTTWTSKSRPSTVWTAKAKP